jgi:hypothetical protein
LINSTTRLEYLADMSGEGLGSRKKAAIPEYEAVVEGDISS